MKLKYKVLPVKIIQDSLVKTSSLEGKVRMTFLPTLLQILCQPVCQIMLVISLMKENGIMFVHASNNLPKI